MYHVERFNQGGWFKIAFAEHKKRLYCDGYVAALDSMYPCDPLRIVYTDKVKSLDGIVEIYEVVYITKGHGKVNLN